MRVATLVSAELILSNGPGLMLVEVVALRCASHVADLVAISLNESNAPLSQVSN